MSRTNAMADTRRGDVALSYPVLVSPPKTSPVLGVVVFCFTSLLVPLLAVSEFGESSSEFLTLLLSYICVLYPSLKLSEMVSVGIARWPIFMFWAFSYLWIGLAGWSQAFSRLNPYILTFSDSTLQMASLLALAGMGACDLGYYLTTTRHRLDKLSTSTGPRKVLNAKRVLVFSLGVLILVPLVVQGTGGWQTLIVTRAQRSESVAGIGLSLAQSGLYGSAVFAAPLVASVALIVLLRSNPLLARRPAWLLLLVMMVAMTLFVNNPVSNPRFIAGTVLLAVLLAFGLGKSGSHFRFVSLGLFLILLFVFPYSDLFRVENTELSVRPLSYFLVSKGDYDTATQLANSVDFRAATGGTGGQQLLTALLFFIPRSEWAQKGDATGSILAAYQNYRYSNVSSPLWTEAFVDFGFVGVIAVFLVLGWCLKRLGCLGENLTSKAPGWTAVALPVLAAYSLLVYRGALLTAIGPLAVLLLLPLLLLRRSGGRSD